MKHKFYFGLLLIFFSLNANLFSQNFWVPDANFRNKLKQLYPSCFTAQDSMITNCNLIQSAQSLNASSLPIASLSGLEYFITLDSLTCRQTNITSLPVLPSSLSYLNCGNNNLSSLPILPDSLKFLICNANHLTSLPALPNSITHIFCLQNQLTNLPTLPSSLIELDCRLNQLINLPTFPNSFQYLYCSGNQITSINSLPDSLRLLDCDNNQLTNLPALPNYVTELRCEYNQLTGLPPLPPLLTTLYCAHNQISSFPTIPNSLISLFCAYNQLTFLPKIPGHVRYLNCSYNPLSCIPELAPRDLGYPWGGINIQHTNITCVPNQRSLYDFQMFQAQLPIPLTYCSPVNNYCSYKFVSGLVFLDENGNGIKDSLEKGVSCAIQYLNYLAWSDSNGVFDAISDTGNITLHLIVPNYYSATTPETQVVHVTATNNPTLYFGIAPISKIQDLKLDLTSQSLLRPGFKIKYKIQYQNIGTDTISNVKLKFLKPQQLSNLNTLPVSNAVNGDTLVWNIPVLFPFEKGEININDSVFASTFIGDTAAAYAWIEPLTGDSTPFNNSAISMNIIKASFDPNDKSVTPELVMSNSTRYLEYTIRFQNTGTDTAFTVMVMDTLSPLLDVNSLQMINASHPFDFWVENRLLRCNFTSILLPDSNANEVESHGFVKFRIKPLPGLLAGNNIPNSASIYFDYNAAVLTNTTVVHAVNPTYYWVPDFHFRNKLKQLYPSCFTAQDSLITGCSQIQNEISLNLTFLQISSLDGIQYFTSLEHLVCYSNHLTSLPALPTSLLSLNCSQNQLTSLPALPTSLLSLACSENQLTSLPALPASLVYLYCTSNQLISLPILPSSLTRLTCENNHLTSLPVLPSSLTHLDCTYNQLSSLPALPSSLTYLWCGQNQLTSLPILPDSIKELKCGVNQLTSLPTLPALLITLDCSLCQLISLPALPASLTILGCSNNQLTTLPALPALLLELYCRNNQLSNLPRIPGRTWKLDFSHNPITCFPEIAPRIPGSPSWVGITMFNTLISCIPNQGTFPLSVIYSSQQLPFCSPANSDCNYNYTFGYVFIDANGNGRKDSLEYGLEAPVNYSGNSVVFANGVGYFNAVSDTGNITFQVAVPLYYSATTPTSQTIHVVSGVVDTLYFALQPIGNINDLKIDLCSIGFLRPSFKAKYQVHYQNVGTNTLNNVQVKFLKPSQLYNFSSLPGANAVSADTLIWNIDTLFPFQQGNIVITDSVFSNATLGDTTTANAWIEPIGGDTEPLNNQCTSINIIRGAFDPNDKSVSPDVVLLNTVGFLEYSIRFQNTGTYRAFEVMVMDTLSALLDVSSLQMISASHSYDLWVENGVAKWNFINILLPDSNTNELESHGFVKFRIKPLPGLTVADSIPNEADIYFDYNVAVTTNTIVVNVVNPLQVHDLKDTELQIFPNPVQDILRIVNQHAGALGKIELINASGEVLETKTISSSAYTWNLQQLPAGTYILRGQGWGQKVVKE